MTSSEIITISISALSLAVSVIALIRDFCTRTKVAELRNLEIEKLKAEKEQQSKAVLYCYIDEDDFVIENSGDAPASNIRYEGWDDWCNSISNKIRSYLPPHNNQRIKLTLTMDSASSGDFKIIWDDDSGKNHAWSQTLEI